MNKDCGAQRGPKWIYCAFNPRDFNVSEEDAQIALRLGFGGWERIDDDIALADDNIVIAFDDYIEADIIGHSWPSKGRAARLLLRLPGNRHIPLPGHNISIALNIYILGDGYLTRSVIILSAGSRVGRDRA